MSKAARIEESRRVLDSLHFVLRRSSRRKTIGLVVDYNGLQVAAPWSVSIREIEDAIARNRDWIAAKLELWRIYPPVARGWQSGEKLHFLGRQLTLEARLALLGHGAYAVRSTLRVFTPDHQSVPQIVVAWYRSEAGRHFAARIAEMAPRLGVSPRRVALSDAKTHWGSCNADGDVRLNWRLMQASPAVIDYVVVHELAHLRHLDHSPRFWSTVASICPKYLELRDELKTKDALYRAL